MVEFSVGCSLCDQIDLKIFLPCGHSLCFHCLSLRTGDIAKLCPITLCDYPSISCTKSLGNLLSKVGRLSNLELFIVSSSSVGTSDRSDADNNFVVENTTTLPADATKDCLATKIIDNFAEPENSLEGLEGISQVIFNNRHENQCSIENNNDGSLSLQGLNLFADWDKSSGSNHNSLHVSATTQDSNSSFPIAQQITSIYSQKDPVASTSTNAQEEDSIKDSRGVKPTSKARKKNNLTPQNGDLTDEPENKKQKRQSGPTKDKDDVWMQHYYKVLNFGEKNKHLNVPKDECIEDDGVKYNIGKWLAGQRSSFLHHVSAEKEEFLLYLINTYGLWMDDRKVVEIVVRHKSYLPLHENSSASSSSNSCAVNAKEKAASVSAALTPTTSIPTSKATNHVASSSSSSSSSSSNIHIRPNKAAAVPVPVSTNLPSDHNGILLKAAGGNRSFPQPENKDLHHTKGILAVSAIVDGKPESSDARLIKRVSSKSTPPEAIYIADTKPTRPQGRSIAVANAAEQKSPMMAGNSADEKSQKETPKVSLRKVVTVKTEAMPSAAVHTAESRQQSHLPDHRLLSPLGIQAQSKFGAIQSPFPLQPPPPPPPPAFPPPMSLTRRHLQLSNERFSPPSLPSNNQLQSQAINQPLPLSSQIRQPIQPQPPVSPPVPPPLPRPPPPPPLIQESSKISTSQQILKSPSSISEGDYIGFVLVHSKEAVFEYGMGKVCSISHSEQSPSYEVLPLKPFWDGQQPLTPETYIHLHFVLGHDEILTIHCDQLHGKKVNKISLQPDGKLSSAAKRDLKLTLSSLGPARNVYFM